MSGSRKPFFARFKWMNHSLVFTFKQLQRANCGWLDKGQTLLDRGRLRQQKPESSDLLFRLFRGSRQPFVAFIFSVILMSLKDLSKMAIRRILPFHTLFIRQGLFVCCDQ